MSQYLNNQTYNYTVVGSYFNFENLPPKNYLVHF
jgi:hypothetical protein